MSQEQPELAEPLPSAGPDDALDPGEPSLPVPADAVVMERPHPLTPVVKSWVALVGFALWTGKDVLKELDDLHSIDRVDLYVWGGLVLVFLLITIISGLISWRTTRFLVDDTQLRIEKSFLTKNSDRIAFTKIQTVDVVQPFAARLLGLAQLHIDAGAGEGRTIEYLGRERAYELRDYLVDRAHGQQVTVAESAARRGQATVMADIATTEQTLVRVNEKNLVIASFLSVGFLMLLVGTVVTVAVGIWIDQALGMVAVLLGLGGGIWGLISHNLMGQWNYSLLRTDQGEGRHGLKITRGLTSLLSQSVPVDRIQAVTITQDLFWRPFKLYRVTIDVLGLGSGDETSQDSNVLLPIGTWPDVRTALDAIWPGFDPDVVPLQGQPRVSRWFSPIGWKYFGWGTNDDVVVIRRGALNRSTTIVHHARVQSVHLSQGPWARRLHIADAKVDTTGGFFSGLIDNIDENIAHAFVMSEMDRCRAARERESALRATHRSLPDADPVELDGPAGAGPDGEHHAGAGRLGER